MYLFYYIYHRNVKKRLIDTHVQEQKIPNKRQTDTHAQEQQKNIDCRLFFIA